MAACTHSYFFPGYSGPGIISDKNMGFCCIRTPGGRLRGITNMGQQLYEADVIPNGLNPSVDMAIRTFRASAALSLCFRSKLFHASPSDGCIIIYLSLAFLYLF